MTEKKKFSLSRAIMKMVMIVPTLLNIFTNLTTIIGYEARLAGKSLVILLTLALFVGSLFTIIWICLLGLLYMYLLSLQWSGYWALLAIILLNVIILMLVLLIMNKIKNNLTFPITRSQFRDIGR